MDSSYALNLQQKSEVASDKSAVAGGKSFGVSQPKCYWITFYPKLIVWCKGGIFKAHIYVFEVFLFCSRMVVRGDKLVLILVLSRLDKSIKI